MMRIALPALFVVLFAAAGCTGRSAADKKEGSDAAQAAEFGKLWPREAVAGLSDEKRQELLGETLVALKGNDWLHAQEVLVSMGGYAVPALVDLVESKEPSAASAGPIPCAQVKTVGQLAHDTLLLIVQNRFNFKGELPGCSVDAWKGWLATHPLAAPKAAPKNDKK